jgi:hypothetical protein
MKQCQLQIVNNSRKMEKYKRTVVKARKKEAILMRFSGFSIQWCMSFLDLNNPTTAKINFELTEI